MSRLRNILDAGEMSVVLLRFLLDVLLLDRRRRITLAPALFVRRTRRRCASASAPSSSLHMLSDISVLSHP